MNIEILYVRVNKNCNARCFMCDFWKNPKMEISKEQFEKAIQHYDSVKLVRFTGGEPLLCELLSSYVEICRSRGIKTSIITNGLLLDKKLNQLAQCGLDQIVMSVDGPVPELHNRIRGVDGLLEKIEVVLHQMHKNYPTLHTRVNTVVSAVNIGFLPALAEWIDYNHIEQWSIIPIKKDGYDWTKEIPLIDFLQYYENFQNISKGLSVKLLGYSRNWAGNAEEFWSGKSQVRPQGKCHVVQKMSFYDPFSEHFYPCNCVPHRSRIFESPEEERDWYYEHGHEYCMGCEPLNAYYADYPGLIEKFILDI